MICELTGPALNIEVAKRIFGLRPFKKWIGAEYGHEYTSSWLDSDDQEIKKPLPDYANEISSAMLVASQMGLKGYNAVFYVRSDGRRAARFTKLDRISCEEKWRKSFNFAEIICQAALEALEEE